MTLTQSIAMHMLTRDIQRDTFDESECAWSDVDIAEFVADEFQIEGECDVAAIRSEYVRQLVDALPHLRDDSDE